MRATEFITERAGKMTKRQQNPTAGANVYHDAEHMNNDYTQYRLSMAVACADTSSDPIDMDAKSWVGKQKTSHPYTKEEQDMLKKAYKAIGANYTDLNGGDIHSSELDSTNTVSPTAKKKTNKYGV